MQLWYKDIFSHFVDARVHFIGGALAGVLCWSKCLEMVRFD